MMSWTYATLLALLAVLLALSLCPEADSAAVPSSTGSAKHPQAGPLKKIFMKKVDASNFFRRRSRRGAKSQDEINAEQRLILAADERKREFHEEKRNEFESYAEEEHDGMQTLISDVAERDEFTHSTSSFIRENSHNLPEQDERTRESTEQWREFHYDGMHPPQEYNRQSI